MTPAAILRAQMSTSTDPARLEREARRIEAGIFSADAERGAQSGVTERTPAVDAGLRSDESEAA